MYCYTMYGISIMVLIVAYDEQFNFVQLSSMRFIKKGPREAQMKNLKDEQINLYAHDYQNDNETIEFGLHTLWIWFSTKFDKSVYFVSNIHKCLNSKII